MNEALQCVEELHGGECWRQVCLSDSSKVLEFYGIPASSAIPSVAEKELDVIFFIRYLMLHLITVSVIVILYFGFYQEHISYLKKIYITSSFVSVKIQS